MEAWLSNHLLGNWKEELDELLKEVVQRSSLGMKGNINFKMK